MPDPYIKPPLRLGTDICSVRRIEASYSRFGQRLLEKVLTEGERAYVESSPAHLSSRLAVRFAAKEAASKVLGTGLRGVGFKEIEVTREPSGKPNLALHGRARERAERLGLTSFEVSLTHETDYAVAFIVGYSVGYFGSDPGGQG